MNMKVKTFNVDCEQLRNQGVSATAPSSTVQQKETMNNKLNSQRTDGFHAGIPFGLSTLDKRTRKIDAFVKQASQELENDEDIKARGFTRTSHFYSDEVGYKESFPDGGVWRYRNTLGDFTPFAFVEAKKQGWGGNAFERLFIYIDIIRDLCDTPRYLVFLVGQGVDTNASMGKEAASKLFREGKVGNSFNIVHANGGSFFRSEHGFTYAEVKDIIKRWLLNQQ